MRIKEEATERHTLAVIVDNEPGILARIISVNRSSRFSDSSSVRRLTCFRFSLMPSSFV